MSTISTLTNEVEVDINYPALMEQYDFYEIDVPDTDKKNELKKFYAEVRRHFKPKAKCLKYSFGNTSYIMAKTKNEPIDNAGYSLKKLGLSQIKEIPHKSMFSMLLSIMVDKKTFFDLVDAPDEIFYPYSFENTTAADMVALRVELKSNEDGFYMTLGATSFKTAREIKDWANNYYVEECGLLRPYDKNRDAGKEVYEKGSRGNKKSTVTMLGLDHSFKSSKAYFFFRIKEEIDASLSDVLRFGFKEKELQVHATGSDLAHQKNRLKEVIREYAKRQQEIHIAVLDPRCQDQAEEIRSGLENLFNDTEQTLFDSAPNITMGSSIKPNMPNIAVTLEKQYYEDHKERDPYMDIDRSFPVQNYTAPKPHKAQKVSETVTDVLLKELAIKCELLGYEPFIEHNIELLQEYRFFAVIDFSRKEPRKTQFYKAYLDGKTFKACAPTEDEAANLIHALLEVPAGEVPEFVVMDRNGRTILGTRTPLYPLPDFEKMTTVFEKDTKEYYFQEDVVLGIADSLNQYGGGNKQPKTREEFLALLNTIKTPKGIPSSELMNYLGQSRKFKSMLEEEAGRRLRYLPKVALRDTFLGMLGITYKNYMTEDGALYHVGALEKSLKYAIEKNSPFRRLMPVPRFGSIPDNEISNILSLLEHYFVKNKDYTVMPYPVKYAREGWKLDVNSRS